MPVHRLASAAYLAASYLKPQKLAPRTWGEAYNNLQCWPFAKVLPVHSVLSQPLPEASFMHIRLGNPRGAVKGEVREESKGERKMEVSSVFLGAGSYTNPCLN